MTRSPRLPSAKTCPLGPSRASEPFARRERKRPLFRSRQKHHPPQPTQATRVRANQVALKGQMRRVFPGTQSDVWLSVLFLLDMFCIASDEGSCGDPEGGRVLVTEERARIGSVGRLDLTLVLHCGGGCTSDLATERRC